MSFPMLIIFGLTAYAAWSFLKSGIVWLFVIALVIVIGNFWISGVIDNYKRTYGDVPDRYVLIHIMVTIFGIILFVTALIV